MGTTSFHELNHQSIRRRSCGYHAGSAARGLWPSSHPCQLEGCLADAALMVANSGNVAKPLQIKTTSVEPKAAAGKNKQFKFQKTNKYPGCLVVCCAFLREGVRCWIIEGDHLKRVKTLTITEKGRWDRFAVDVNELANTLMDRINLPSWASCRHYDPRFFQPQTAKQRLEVKGHRELMRFETCGSPSLKQSMVSSTALLRKDSHTSSASAKRRSL